MVTALYEELGKDGFLTVEDLSHQVEIFSVPVSDEFKFNSHGLLNRERFNLENVKQMICANSKYDEAKPNTGFLLMLSEVTVTVIIKRQLFSPDTLKLAVLDSHGRDKDGRICSDGMSVLMFFDNVSSFIDYVSQTYLDTHNSEYLLPYQIQFVHCSSSMTEETRKRIVRLHRSSSFLLCAKIKRIEGRANESREQQSARLEKQRRSENLKRSNETIAERSTRLMKKRNFDNLKRSNETAIERLERLGKKRKRDNYRRSNETVVTRQLRLSRLRKYLKLSQSRERTEKSRTFVTTMENRMITKKQESVTDKLLKLAKQRKLVKLIQFSKITVRKASQCPGLPIETTEIPENLGTIEGAFKNVEAMETTSNQTLKRKDSEVFLTRSEEILSTDKCSQSMGVEANLMQNELNMLSMIPFSSADNALNVNKFLTDIEAGPYYICKSCNRMLYRKSVRKFQTNTYSIDIFTDVPSFDNEQYICNTCHSKLIKGKIPCQAVYNKLQMDQVPLELEELRKLESILVVQRLVFQKIVVLPKGQQKKN